MDGFGLRTGFLERPKALGTQVLLRLHLDAANTAYLLHEKVDLARRALSRPAVRRESAVGNELLVDVLLGKEALELLEARPSQPQQLAVTPCARGDENEPLLVDAVDEQPVRLDMALAVPAIRPAQRVVAHRFRQDLPAHGHLEGRLEPRDVLALPPDAPAALLELRREPQPSMAYPSSSAATASLTVR